MRLSLLLVALPAAGLASCTVGRALHVASALTAHQLCAQAFVARQPVEPLMESYVRPFVGVPVVRTALRYEVDRGTGTVRASVAGAFVSRAQYDEGRGCTVLNGGGPPAPVRRWFDTTFAPVALPVAIDPGLAPATSEAFTADRRAILVLRDGRIVAEHYAPGYTADTRLQSWSMAKSITNALIGVLVRRGQTSVEAQVPGLPVGVTVDRLLRQTSGQPFGSSNSGFDRASRMQFLEPDTAAYAATAFSGHPGERWSYTDGNYALLSRHVRRAVGDTPEAVVRFADRELFGPAGMRSALLEFDGAGTPMGASWAYATARDWARFGLLYANDGVANGRRILPAGWVAYSASPTRVATVGYGAGFWTNAGDSAGARQRRAWGLPSDSFFALGNSGQVLLVAPAARIVIVSLGFSVDATNRAPVAAVGRLYAAAASDRSGAEGRKPLQAPLTRRLHGRTAARRMTTLGEIVAH